MDIPQEGLRAVVLPADPLPIMNPRPENYVNATNPLSVLGANPSPALYRFSTQIGNMTGGGGLPAAFNGATNKPFEHCANRPLATAGYNNYVGINWGGDNSGITTPSSLAAPIHTHVAGSFKAYAPNDRSFLNGVATGYSFDGSNDAVTWTALATGTTAGTAGETITGVPTTMGAYQFHRLVFNGDGLHTIAVAQLQINVSDGNSEP